MKMRSGWRAWWVGLVVASLLAACSQAAPPAEQTSSGSASTSAVEGATPAGTAVGHFNPTEAVGGGANSSSSVTDLASVFASVNQASQLKITANSSPPGATGADVQSVSVLAQDPDGLLSSLDVAAKQSLADALLTAAGAAWPNASISMLITASNGAGGTIIGNRVKGGPNTVIAS